MTSVGSSSSSTTPDVLWTRSKLQADALLRYHSLPGLLQHVPELLQFWVTHTGTEAGRRPQQALCLLQTIHAASGEHMGEDVHLLLQLQTLDLKAGFKGKGPRSRLQWLLTSLGLSAAACSAAPSAAEVNQGPGFDPLQVLVPLVFGGKTVLTVSHARATLQKIESDADSVAGSQCHSLYAAHDAVRNTSDVQLPFGFSPQKVASRLRLVFGAKPRVLTQIAFQLACLGWRKPSITVAGLEPCVSGSHLVMQYARWIDDQQERTK